MMTDEEVKAWHEANNARLIHEDNINTAIKQQRERFQSTYGVGLMLINALTEDLRQLGSAFPYDELLKARCPHCGEELLG
jgi:hypothetical protein